MPSCEVCSCDYDSLGTHNSSAHHVWAATKANCHYCLNFLGSSKGPTSVQEQKHHYDTTACHKEPAESTKLIPCELCCYQYKDIEQHKKAPMHSSGAICGCPTCKKQFSSTRALGRHYRTSTCAQQPSKKPITFCKLCWSYYTRIKHHEKSKTHLGGAALKCQTCSQELSGPLALQLHCNDTGCVKPPHITKYECEACRIFFASPKSLKKHLANKTFHPPTPIIPEDPESFCTQCNKQCKSVTGLKAHLDSVIHNPLTLRFSCVASPSCRKSFNAPSALLYHLESGTCPSKLTWKTLAELIIAHDHTNIVTEPDATITRAAFAENMLLYLGIDTDTNYSTDGGVMFTPPPMSRTSSMSSEIGGAKIMYTPTEGSDNSHGTITPQRNSIGSNNSDDFVSFDFLPRWAPHDSTSENDSEFPTGIPTPSAEEDGHGERGGNGIFLGLPAVVEQIEYACPLCSEKKKKFKTRVGLERHMESQTHASRIYHCPLELLVSGSENNGRTRRKARKFKALSALVQHIEVGSCEGGKAAFGPVVEFVDVKLREAGLGEIKVDI